MVGVFWFLIGGPDVASSRLQGYLIHENLLALGYNSVVFFAPSKGYAFNAPEVNVTLGSLDQCVAIIQKLRGDNTDRLIAWLKSKRCKVVYVNCDMEVDNNCWANADEIFVTSERLLDYHRRGFISDIKVIDEPYEFASVPVESESKTRLKALWFGHRRNWDAILRWKKIIESEFSDRVDMLTCSDHCDATHPWSLDLQEVLLKESDVVLLPTQATPEFVVKSANRLVQSMAAGKAIIHGPLDSYRKVIDGSSVAIEVGNDSEFRQALVNCFDAKYRNELSHRAYEHVSLRYSPKSVSERWASLLSLERSNRFRKMRFLSASLSMELALKTGVIAGYAKRGFKRLFKFTAV